MNNVVLIGRLTRDPEVKYINAENPLAVATFTVAIDRPTRAGQEKKTDFPRVQVFGRVAENCEKFLSKGRLVGIQGRLQTGNYINREGVTVYTTDVVAERVEFLEWGDKKAHNIQKEGESKNAKEEVQEMPEEFQEVKDEDIPF